MLSFYIFTQTIAVSQYGMQSSFKYFSGENVEICLKIKSAVYFQRYSTHLKICYADFVAPGDHCALSAQVSFRHLPLALVSL